MDIPENDAPIVAGLRRGAAGSHRAVAAVELLIEAHQHTLSKVLAVPVVRQHLCQGEGEALMVDWQVLRQIAAAGLRHELILPARAAQICMIASELAWDEDYHGYPLTKLLSGLDGQHTELVLRAVRRHQGLPVGVYPAGAQGNT